jgi:hypothetical protein
MMDENAYLAPHVVLYIHWTSAWAEWIAYLSPMLHRWGAVEYDEAMSPPNWTFDDYGRARILIEAWVANHELSGRGGHVRIQDHLSFDEYRRRAKVRHNRKEGE